MPHCNENFCFAETNIIRFDVMSILRSVRITVHPAEWAEFCPFSRRMTEKLYRVAERAKNQPFLIFLC